MAICGARNTNLSYGTEHTCDLEPGHQQPHVESSTRYWWEVIGDPKPTPLSGTALIKAECDVVKALLVEKNEKYGNQLLEPKKWLSPATPIDRIDARIDEKLARLEQVGRDAADEDTVLDLIGLLIVRRIAARVYR